MVLFVVSGLVTMRFPLSGEARKLWVWVHGVCLPK